VTTSWSKRGIIGGKKGESSISTKKKKGGKGSIPRGKKGETTLSSYLSQGKKEKGRTLLISGEELKKKKKRIDYCPRKGKGFLPLGKEERILRKGICPAAALFLHSAEKGEGGPL